MAFVCSATWTARAGEEETVSSALAQLAPASRAESGNRIYQAYRDPGEPTVFRIFEVYDDEAAFEAHVASPHFQQWALGQAIPVLENRERGFFETLDV